jgi:hypothetical protein
MAEAGKSPKRERDPPMRPTRREASRRFLDNARGLAVFFSLDVSRVWHWGQDKPMPFQYALRYVTVFPDDFPDATATVVAYLKDRAQQGVIVVEHAARIPHSDDDTGTK